MFRVQGLGSRGGFRVFSPNYGNPQNRVLLILGNLQISSSRISEAGVG